MRRKILFFVFAILAFGCDKNETTFVIRNQTNDTIKGVVVQNHQQKSINNTIAPRESLTIILPLKRRDSIVRDGEYLLHYWSNGKKKIKNFGYYTNNTVLNNNYLLLFKNDTVVIRQE